MTVGRRLKGRSRVRDLHMGPRRAGGRELHIDHGGDDPRNDRDDRDDEEESFNVETRVGSRDQDV